MLRLKETKKVYVLESNYSKLLASEFAHALVEKMKEAFKIECK